MRSNEDILQETQQIQTQLGKIREDIKYNNRIEAIEQFLHLFNLVSDICDYHAKEEASNQNYTILLESCLEFIESIKKSIFYFGALAIEDIAIPFDAAIHRYDGENPRGRVVNQVIRVGFKYGDTILQKAQVTLVP